MRLIYSCVFFILFFNLKSQTTVTLKPNSSEGKDALLYNRDQINRGQVNYLAAAGWTNNGNPSVYRFLLQYNLDFLPQNAEILDAKLNLFFPYNVDFFNSGQNGENRANVERVLEKWNELTVNWSNQPQSTSDNAATIYKLNEQQNALELNVAEIIKDIIATGENHGFLVKLDNETPYNNLVFASSDNEIEALHPELIITYSTHTCLEIKADNYNSKDAIIHSVSREVNRGNVEYLASAAWTNSGDESVYKSLLQFTLPELNESQNLIHAGLNLYFSDRLNFFGNKQNGENRSYIARITQEWEEDQVTWSNSPNIDFQNKVILDNSITEYQSYTNIDITNIIQASYDEGNFGFLMYPEKESPYNNLYFASTEFSNPLYRPMLKICYEETSSLSDNASHDVKIYPNPTMDEFRLSDDKGLKNILITNALGSIVKNFPVNYSNVYSIVDLPSGPYTITLINEKKSVYKNFTLLKTD